jgi:hypothetical protein
MTRQVQALGEPPDRLIGFPRWTLTHDRTIYRAHSATNGPWWFASAHGTTTDGRFDLADPYGTCYLASTENGAVRERWGKHLATLRSVTSAMADDTLVSALKTPHVPRLADTINGKAAQHGVIREIGTMTPYALTQRWAAAFHELGCGGIRYLPRFSTGQRDNAFALFGAAGGLKWPGDPAPTSGRTAAASLDIQVLDPPHSVRRIKPPA